jgi:succinate dehydrogenase/fumarate reductase flavoprotein subunit
MWVNAGLLRSDATLREGLSTQMNCEARLMPLVEKGARGRRLSEAVAASSVARAILESALARTESRGAHFRNDFPKRDDQRFLKHSIYLRNAGGAPSVVFEKW